MSVGGRGGGRRVHGGFVVTHRSAEHGLESGGGNTNVTRDGETLSAALAVHRCNHYCGFDILGGFRVP